MNAAPEQLRVDICRGMRRLEQLGLNRGTSGNLSARCADGFVISASGVKADALEPDLVVGMTMDGQTPVGSAQPSSEWRFHRDIYVARREVGAVVHVHSPYATALACQRRGIPAFHYMIAVAGGDDIRCAPYATFGSQALSDHAIVALAGRRACLLANHGLIALGIKLESAIDLAVEVEELARQYSLSWVAGEPQLLSAVEMTEVLEKFKTYGARHERK